MKKQLLIFTLFILSLFVLSACNITVTPLESETESESASESESESESKSFDEELLFDPTEVSFISAYNEAQRLGFVGTLDEFIKLISGKDGTDGKDGKTPTIEISNDGYWIINGEKTEHKAAGAKDGVGIKSVAFDEEGRLVITLTDDTTLPPVALPESIGHVHTYGEWMPLNSMDRSTPCDERFFYRVCTDCSEMALRLGAPNGHSFTVRTVPPTCVSEGYDEKICTVCGERETFNYTSKASHSYADKYSYDGDYHWRQCKNCSAFISRGTHTAGYGESCSVCDYPSGIILEHTVTFYYADLTGVTTAELASMIDANGKLTNTALYTKSYQKICESGEGVAAPTSKQMAAAEVRGYERGWSSNAWKRDVTEDITVYATYYKLKDVKVTFTNSNGAPIYVLDTYATYRVEKEEYPDTYELVYYYSATYLASLEECDMADYVEYAPKDVNGNDILMDKDSQVTTDTTKAEKQYILATDQEKLATGIALPFGWYFDAWSGKVTSLQINGTVTAEVKKADGLITKTNITVDGTKDEGYVEIGGLYPNIISNKRENGKTGDYPLYAKYKSIEEVPEADKIAWQAQKDAWEAATKPVCSCGEFHDPIDATLYLAWDGEFVYVYAEVKDAHVVSHGKSYCQNRANPFENDGIEIWYGIAGDFNKACLDAFGYKLYGSGEGDPNTSAYINKCKSASKLMTADGPLDNATFSAWNGAIVNQQTSKDAGITGYTVEFSFAAYEEPILSDGEELKDDKSNWGKQLTTGQIFSLSIQLDDISETASQDIVYRAIASEATGAVTIDNLYGAEGTKNPNERINLGVQARNADQDGVFTLILG